MARLARAEVFDPCEVAVLHICARVVRRCYFLALIRLLAKTTITEKSGSKVSSNYSKLTSGAICKNPDKLATIRKRLSDVAWWMRLLCQNIGTRENREDKQVGKFFQGRYRAVRILDEEKRLKPEPVQAEDGSIRAWHLVFLVSRVRRRVAA